MPNYDYRCSNCKTVIEKFHAMSIDPKIKCPNCGDNMIRLISGGAGVIFKGEGFYRSVDYINQKSREEGMTHGDDKKIRKESL